MNTQNSANIELVAYIIRKMEPALREALARGKSVLLLGPRQTGKTTLLHHLPWQELEMLF